MVGVTAWIFRYICRYLSWGGERISVAVKSAHRARIVGIFRKMGKYMVFGSERP